MVTPSRFIWSTDHGFNKSCPNNRSQFEDKIQKLYTAFAQDISEGDVYDIVYTPERGTEVFKNGELKVQIDGLEFKKVFWGIWFCDDPCDDVLKQRMLGDEEYEGDGSWNTT